jgi:hypothetical protein
MRSQNLEQAVRSRHRAACSRIAAPGERRAQSFNATGVRNWRDTFPKMEAFEMRHRRT